ncbi:MAG: oxygenase MpaB family protein [Cyanobacteria bacterium P01_F01_bin.86]
MTGHPFTVFASTFSPERDHVAICHRLVGYDFPWEMNRALELAVLRTFCVPRISKLLKQTGEFVHRSQKRYDDTSLILGNIMKWGYDSPQGRAAIATMNRIHRRYAIHNDDFLYVLSVLIYEPVRWNACYGWRPFSGIEKHALFEFWRVVGQRMGITHIPASYEAFEQFNQTYEEQHFRYSPDNQMIGDAVVALMQSWLPATAAPMVPMVVRSLVDDRLREALGWPQPPSSLRWTIRNTLHWGRRGAQLLPQRRHANFLVDTPNTTYPTGYNLATLGPEETLPESGTSRCPFMRMQSFFKARV